MPFLAHGRLVIQHKCSCLLKNLEHTSLLLLGHVFKVMAQFAERKIMFNFSNKSNLGAGLSIISTEGF
jgi:hypothetical protein